MTEHPFLSIDELAALDRMLADYRHEALMTRRYGRVSKGDDMAETAATVEGIIRRHRDYTLRDRAASPT